ncbi:MAG: hypothetical protein EBR09_15535, partial [Proteobacteria bacterium]|nr:hypothetical protein [Pseudomonadota bacterium]
MKALQAFVKLLSRLLLVTMLPATIVVACSGLPDEDQGVSKNRLSKTITAPAVISEYGGSSTDVKTSYNYLSKRLKSNELVEVEKLLADVKQRKDGSESKSRIAVSGLRIGIALLPFQKENTSRYWKRLRNLREIAIFYGPELIEKINSNPSALLSLTQDPIDLETAENKSWLEKLETTIEVLSSAARGSGVEVGRADKITPAQLEISEEIESAMGMINADVLSNVIPVVRTAARELQRIGGLDAKSLDRLILNATIQAVSVSKLLTNAVKEGRIDQPGLYKAVDEWATTLVEKNKLNPIEAATSVQIQTDIPSTVPILNPKNGAYDGVLGKWLFTLEQQPKSGSVDLSKNPPVYQPNENFDQADTYSFKLCHADYRTICSETFVKAISRPNLADSITLETTGRGFLPSAGATCVVGPQETRTLFYAWYMKAPAANSPVVRLAGANGKILVNEAIPRGT